MPGSINCYFWGWFDHIWDGICQSYYHKFLYITLHSIRNQPVHLQNTSQIFVNTFHQVRGRYHQIFDHPFCAHLISSIFPLLILLIRDKDGRGKSSNNILYDRDKDGEGKSSNNILYECIDVYLRKMFT